MSYHNVPYLNERIALVTGANGGIGRAICQRFIDEGAIVYALDIQERGVIESENLHYVQHDVSDEQNAVNVFSSLKAKHNNLDVLVNAAAIEIEENIENTSLAQWNQVFAVNVTGTFLTSKYAIDLLRHSKGASIINFGSYDGFIADPNLAAYCASKGAIHALTKAMACDYGPENIRVNAICPGYVDTPMLQSFFGSSGDVQSLQQAVRDVHPLRTYGKPEDIANLVNWLAGDEARYASGQLWIMDGGLTAQVQQMKL